MWKICLCYTNYHIYSNLLCFLGIKNHVDIAESDFLLLIFYHILTKTFTTKYISKNFTVFLCNCETMDGRFRKQIVATIAK